MNVFKEFNCLFISESDAMLIVRLLAGMEVGQFETIYNSGAMDGGRSSVMLRVD